MCVCVFMRFSPQAARPGTFSWICLHGALIPCRINSALINMPFFRASFCALWLSFWWLVLKWAGNRQSNTADLAWDMHYNKPLLLSENSQSLFTAHTQTYTHTALNQQSALLYLTVQASTEGERCCGEWLAQRTFLYIASKMTLKEISMLLYFYHQFFSHFFPHSHTLSHRHFYATSLVRTLKVFPGLQFQHLLVLSHIVLYGHWNTGQLMSNQGSSEETSMKNWKNWKRKGCKQELRLYVY